MSLSISLPRLNATSRTDLYADFPNPSSLNQRRVSANPGDLHREMHLCTYTSNQCFEQMRQISEKVRESLINFYADMRMFVRALNSMFGETTPGSIERRIDEVRLFKATMLGPRPERRAQRRFERLSVDTKNLFFYTTVDYVIQFGNAAEPHDAEIKSAILRECNQVMYLQRVLSTVNTFFRAFMQRSSETTERERESDDFWGWLHGRREVPGDGSISTTRPGPGTPVDLNIPNTVPYNRDAIPEDVARKANDIIALSGTFAGAIPARFKDSISLEFMAIPVFDASHPAVQNGLPALRDAVSAGNTVIDQLNARHHMDKESMDQHIGAGGVPRYWETHADATCPACRHPVRMDSLRIDTGLQDEILAFLRR